MSSLEEQELYNVMDDICWWFPHMTPSLQQHVLDIVCFKYYESIRSASYVYSLREWFGTVVALYVTQNRLHVPDHIERRIVHTTRRYAYLQRKYSAGGKRRAWWRRRDLHIMMALFAASRDNTWLKTIESVQRDMTVPFRVRCEACRIVRFFARREQLDPRSRSNSVLPLHVQQRIMALNI